MALGTAAALIAPGSASGVVTIGSDLSAAPVDNACTEGTPCTVLGFQAGAPLAQTSPIDGVIVRWRLRAGAAKNGDVALRVLRADPLFSASAHGTSETEVSLPGVNTFPTRLSIEAGDSVGIDNATGALYYGLGTGTNIHMWDVPLVDGAPPRPADRTGSDVLLVNADVEPDVDGDQFGDETQDECPTDAGKQDECDPPETTITKRPKNKIEKSKATFKFGSDEPGSSFECKKDKKPWKLCSSPTKMKRLEVGKHKFKVRATDPAGNTGEAAKDKFRVVA